MVPSNRPERLKEFIGAWSGLFIAHDVKLIVVCDTPEPFHKDALSWKDIPDFIPRETDMIRSYGFFKAYQTDPDYILSLDDDVTPVPGIDIFEEYEKGFNTKFARSQYLSVGSLTSSGLEMRGFPYEDRACALPQVQYGSWEGVLDYDAVTQLANPRDKEGFHSVTIPVPVGIPVTTCIMNCAFKKDFTPMMWQLPLFEGKYNRFGDIWSGLFQKKVIDFSGGVMLINGKARVKHERASDPLKNLEREKPGIDLNEDIWTQLVSGTYKEVTSSAYNLFRTENPEYAEHFIKSRDKWLELFK